MSLRSSKKNKNLAASIEKEYTVDDVHTEDLKNEKRAALKWNLAVGCMALRFLLDGVEYAIVLPTLYRAVLKIRCFGRKFGFMVKNSIFGQKFDFSVEKTAL